MTTCVQSVNCSLISRFTPRQDEVSEEPEGRDGFIQVDHVGVVMYSNASGAGYILSQA